MKFDSMKEVVLTQAKNIFLFDCRVVGLDTQTLSAFRQALGSFVHFTGDILVKELTPEHVRVYIDNLADGPSEGDQHTRSVIYQYAIIHEWIRWLYAQKFVTERTSNHVKPPHLTNRFPANLPTAV
jgi:site-specific recombinase XerD